MSDIFRFTQTPIPPISEVGGKAHSLITMSNAGFVVPNGFVCGAGFFKPWNELVEKSDQWQKLQDAIAKEAELSPHIEAVKKNIQSFTLSQSQQDEIDGLLKTLQQDALYAVRSSSPEEDLEGSSFAGIYETVLGVETGGIKDAILQVFLSAFDERVFVYKKAKGFVLAKVKIAVIIMEQIHSDSAGVGFSVNPINNDYDEAAINANFGLGESVVGGIVTPDYFVVNKTNGDILSKKLGNKNKSVYIADTIKGGTKEKTNENAKTLSISDKQAGEIAAMIVKVEKLYGLPMDIEWAYSQDQLYMIQARPITTFIPLPVEMLSVAGAKKRTLYYDCSVLEGVTTNKPITIMTLDWTTTSLANAMVRPYIGEVKYSADGDPQKDIFFGKGVRLYMNFSQLLFLESPKALGKTFKEADQATADALLALDVDVYKPDEKFPYLKWGHVIPFALRSIWRSHKIIRSWLGEIVHPMKYFEEKYTPCAEEVIQKLKEMRSFEGDVSEYLEKSNALLSQYVEAFAPIMASYVSDLAALSKMFEKESPEKKRLADELTMGIAGDEAVDIGIQLYKLSRILPEKSFADIGKLVEQFKKGQLPDDFMKAWHAFTDKHGMRGPNEMELANARYSDDPALAFEQMASMLEAKQDPEKALEGHVEEREKAYKELLEGSPKHESKKLKKYYENIHRFAPSRDTLKYIFVLINHTLRKLVLRDGGKLVAAGKIEMVEDVFFLTFEELAGGGDLKKLVAKRKPFFQAASANVQAFPIFIDSRGRIVTAEAEQGESDDPNILKGNGISRGVVRGRVKVLKDPREKKIEKGDILVTYNTDPGWTPLFVGASGIILEIGAVLQHGGVVAREYAKPCVAGIRGITQKLHDGQEVEVDGTNGIVKILD